MNVHTFIRALRDYNPQLPIVIQQNDKACPLMLSDINVWVDTDNPEAFGKEMIVLSMSAYREPSQPQRIYDPNQKLTIGSLVQYIYDNFDMFESAYGSEIHVENLNGSSSHTLDIEAVHAKYGKLILLAP